MCANRLRIGTAVASLLAVAFAATAADRLPLRRDAEQLKAKLSAIRGGMRPAGRSARTTITEQELNAYLIYEVAGDLPAGVVEPSVTILGPNRLSGRAIVDLDRVRQAINPTSRLDPSYYLTGRVPVAATGTLTANAGVARFQLESADVAGVPVPKFVLQEIVGYYSRSAGHPAGLSLDSTFDLPAGIREIQVDRGRAIVIQ
jgi:hypothetical protein